MNITIKKPDKKSLKHLAIVLVAAILIGIGFFYYLKLTEIKELPEEKPAGKPMKEIIKSLTAPIPEGGVEPVPEEVIKSLTAPE